MALPMHVFREYDIRGLVKNELTPQFAEQLGRGFGSYLVEKNPGAQSIVLGRDHRTSSEGLGGSRSNRKRPRVSRRSENGPPSDCGSP